MFKFGFIGMGNMGYAMLKVQSKYFMQMSLCLHVQAVSEGTSKQRDRCPIRRE